MLQLNHILLARDFSSISDQALRYAADLAQRSEATLHLLYANVLHDDPFGDEPATPEVSPEERIRKRLRLDPEDTPLTERYPGLKVEVDVRRDIAAAPAILNYAADADVDLIAMGTHGRRGVRRLLLGSVAEEVVRRAERPVLTVRRDEAEETPTIERILVPIDFSDFSEEALRNACAWARLYDAQLDLLHVVEENLHPAFYVGGVQSIYDVQPDIDEKARKRMREQLEAIDAEAASRAQVHVETGRAARKITQFAERAGSDLVIMSTHGLTGLEHFLLGSVTEKVVRHVAAPVLTVKAFGKSIVAPRSAGASEASAAS